MDNKYQDDDPDYDLAGNLMAEAYSRMIREERIEFDALLELYGGLIFIALLCPGCGHHSVAVAIGISAIVALLGVRVSVSRGLWKNLVAALAIFVVVLYAAMAF